MANNSIGALWRNESKKGTEYFSGNIEIDGQKHKIVVFWNDYKEGDRQPDLKIYPHQEKSQGNRPSSEDREYQGSPQDEQVRGAFGGSYVHDDGLPF